MNKRQVEEQVLALVKGNSDSLYDHIFALDSKYPMFNVIDMATNMLDTLYPKQNKVEKKVVVSNRPVAYTFKECPSCGAPIQCHEVYSMPTDYIYEDDSLNGLPTYCIGTATNECINCREY